MRSSAASGPARVAYATNTPSWTPSGTSASGRPSSTTAIWSPLRRANSWSAAINLRAAPGRSRHQPSGRLPITLLPSTMSRRRRDLRHDQMMSPARARSTRPPRDPRELEHLGPDDREAGPGRDEHAWKPCQRASRAAGSLPYHAGIAHLRPLVGAHDDRVVARRDVGDQLRVGDDDAEPRTRRRESLHRAEPRLERVVASADPCRARSREIARSSRSSSAARTAASAIASVGDRRRIERPGVDAAAFARAHSALRAVTTASAVTRSAP